MKFLCGNCKAKYQIADEKASGRTLRMKCRRCGHDILIDGHAMALSPSSAPAAASNSTRRSNSTVSVLPGAPRTGSGAHAMPRPPTMPGAGSRPATRSKPPSALNADFRRHIAAPPEVPQRTAPYDLWHVAIQDVPVGPMTRDELGRKIDAGAVTADSLCWREGMDDWRPLGELPELAQLLRRPRGGAASVRPPRPRMPASPQGARGSMFPLSDDDFDDEGSEPTRIADMTGGQPALSAAAAGSISQPKMAAVPPPAPQPAPAPAPAVPAAPERASMVTGRMAKANSSGQLTTGIAVGLLIGILLVGGPMLYRATWGSPAPQPTAQVAVAPVAEQPSKTAEDLAAQEVDLNVAEENPDDKAGAAGTPDKKPAAQGKVAAKGDAQKGGPKDKLSDEQRKLLERMGGGSNSDPDLSGPKPRGEGGGGGGGGPSLTPAQLSKVVQENKQSITRCYESALRQSGGKQEGTIKVTVTVTVGMSGTVKSVDLDGAGLANMNDCIRQSVRRWRFPQSGGDSPFAFPLVFQPGA